MGIGMTETKLGKRGGGEREIEREREKEKIGMWFFRLFNNK
jgi:hypothetical protein